MMPETTVEKTEDPPAGDHCPECSYSGKRRVKLCESCSEKVLHSYELCKHIGSYQQTKSRRQCEECQAETDENFASFWKPIVCDEQGNLDLEKVKLELFDFHYVMGAVAIVYGHITGGRLSKPNYSPDAVIGEVERLQQEEICQTVTDAVGEEKEEIIAYLQAQLDRFKLNRNYTGCLKMVLEDLQANRYKPEIEEKTDG